MDVKETAHVVAGKLEKCHEYLSEIGRALDDHARVSINGVVNKKTADKFADDFKDLQGKVNRFTSLMDDLEEDLKELEEQAKNSSAENN